jgi:hypothetical protein
MKRVSVFLRRCGFSPLNKKKSHETPILATGWLVTVLSQNFEDVKGFLVVLFSILVGFSTSFRLLFADNYPTCGIEIDSETENFVQVCDDNPFGTLRKSLLSTFELTILATYEPSMIYESQHSALAVLVFVAAVTCVLVVVLNALISLLADSYARVQENAAANRRKEKAQVRKYPNKCTTSCYDCLPIWWFRTFSSSWSICHF